MRVEVSGKQFVFPRSCACCSSYAVTSIEVLGTERNRRALTKGWAWDIPYCQACRQHVRQAERLKILSLVGGALGIAAGFVVGFFDGWRTGLTVASLGSISVILLGWAAFRYLRSRCHTNCWGLTRAVEYLGSNRDCHAFEIKDFWFAKAFILANHRKIVNASTKVAGILRNTEFGDYQVPRKLTKRN